MEDRNWQIVESWMELYGDRIVRVIFLIIDDHHQAEEITQEVFVRAYQNISSFRGESSPYTWLYRIALNLSRNYLKRQTKIRFLPFRNGEKESNSLQESDPLQEPVEDTIIRRTFGRMIRKCIKELPLIYREIMILHYFEDLKISEISQVLQQPEGTVKSKLSRGRELLKKSLGKEGLEDGTER